MCIAMQPLVTTWYLIVPLAYHYATILMIIHGITFAAPGPQLYIRISTKGDRKRIDSGQAMS